MNPQTREKKIVQTSIVGIATNVFLVVFKAIIGFITGSVSIVMDALNNLTDALSSVITIIGTKLSNKRPNKKHPFGYGRVEYITSIIIASLVIFAGYTDIRESITTLVDLFKGGENPVYSDISLIIISVAVLVKVLLGLYFRHMGKKVDSDNLKASGTDALMDSILSLSTLIAALICRFTNVSIEGYLGIIIGCFIVKSGIEILMDAFKDIIGVRAEKSLTQKIKAKVRSIPGVRGTYDLILNSYGPNKTIGIIHVEVRDDMTAKEIHALTRRIQKEIYLEFGIIMTVGIYASNDSDPESRAIKNTLIQLVKQEKDILQLHGFYVDEASKRVSFDLIISFDNKNPIALKDKIVAELEKAYPDYHYDVNLDADYTD